MRLIMRFNVLCWFIVCMFGKGNELIGKMVYSVIFQDTSGSCLTGPVFEGLLASKGLGDWYIVP